MRPIIPQTSQSKRALVVLLVWALVLVPTAPYAMAVMHDNGSLPCHTEQQPAMPDCPHCVGEGSAFACQCLDQLNPSQLANPLARVNVIDHAIALKRTNLFTPLPHSPIYRQDKPPRHFI